MNPIPEEHLQELIDLAVNAKIQLPIITNQFNYQYQVSVIKARERYRRLSFELAGELAREVLELRAKAKESVSAETIGKE
jgi:hypothetical protein